MKNQETATEQVERILLLRDERAIEHDRTFAFKICDLYKPVFTLKRQVEKETGVELFNDGDAVIDIYNLINSNKDKKISLQIKEKMVDNSIGSFGGLPLSRQKLIDMIELPTSVKLLEDECEKVEKWKNEFERWKKYGQYVDHIVLNKNDTFVPTQDFLQGLIEEHSIYTKNENEVNRYNKLQELVELVETIANEYNLPLEEIKLKEINRGPSWATDYDLNTPCKYKFDLLIVRDKK